MEGKISKTGNLQIYRKNELSCCLCGFIDNHYCGDHCALFGEPTKLYDTKYVDLSLCHKTIRFTKFTDERE